MNLFISACMLIDVQLSMALRNVDCARYGT